MICKVWISSYSNKKIATLEESQNPENFSNWYLIAENNIGEINIKPFELKNSFEAVLLNSIVVFFSKSDLIEIGEKQFKNIVLYCQEKKIPRLNISTDWPESEPKSQHLSSTSNDEKSLSLQDKISLKAIKLYNSQKIYTEAEIVDYAQRIAESQPKVSVLKYNTTTEYVTKTKQVPHERWAGTLGKWVGRKTTVWKDEPYEELVTTQTPYNDVETPDYQIFINISREELKKKTMEECITQAKSMMCEEILMSN